VAQREGDVLLAAQVGEPVPAEEALAGNDEVVAMESAGLTEKEQIRRLEKTQQYFELSSEQEQYLRDKGVSPSVINAMRDMKPDQARLASDKTDSSDKKKDNDVDMRTDPR
jgi:hypothetical protein